ncbi:MAG: YpdA family putative bacillithiol disulfide reductase [Sphingobacterium sp.]
MESIFDVLIVGGGPIGIACGIAAKRAGLKHIIIEKGCLTNSLYNYPINMTFFSTSDRLEIGDTPFATTRPKPERAEALEYYRRIDQKFALNTHLFETVQHVERLETGVFHVTTSKNDYHARHVVVATGFYDIPMHLNVPGEGLDKVRHYYNDPHYYAKQKVIVVGASNSSIDAALETYRKGADVTLVVRGPEISPRVKYWVRPDIENRISGGEIKAFFRSNITQIGERAVEVATPEGLITLENDFVLALTGYRPNFDFLRQIGISIPDLPPCIPAHDPETMETNIPGLYLAGVVCGGLNTHLWFIENSRVHAETIITDILQKASAS